MCLRKACKIDLRLATNVDSPGTDLPAMSFSCNNLAMIFCKCALGHIMVNVALLDLYDKDPTALPSAGDVLDTRDTLAPEEAPSREYLNLEVEGMFELARSSFTKALVASPLGWRGMVSTWRVMCSHAREARCYHPIWDRLHRLVYT